MRLVLLLLENGASHIARLMNLRPVDLRLHLGFVPGSAGRPAASLQNVRAHTLGLVLFNRARMRLLFGHADFGQSIQNGFALDFQFTR
jgi:hypothetical protein